MYLRRLLMNLQRRHFWRINALNHPRKLESIPLFGQKKMLENHLRARADERRRM